MPLVSLTSVPRPDPSDRGDDSARANHKDGVGSGCSALVSAQICAGWGRSECTSSSTAVGGGSTIEAGTLAACPPPTNAKLARGL